MNLIEALRTNKPLRRPIAKHMGSLKDGWVGNEFIKYLLLDHNNVLLDNTNYWKNFITEQDLLADDWEVKND